VLELSAKSKSLKTRNDLKDERSTISGGLSLLAKREMISAIRCPLQPLRANVRCQAEWARKVHSLAVLRISYLTAPVGRSNTHSLCPFYSDNLLLLPQ
jgi:hypothetical protein